MSGLPKRMSIVKFAQKQDSSRIDYFKDDFDKLGCFKVID